MQAVERRNRRYLVIKGGGWPGSLARRRGITIKNRAIKASQSVTWQYAVLGVPNAVVGDTDEGEKHPGKYPRCFAFSGRGAGGGKLRVCYARDAWRMNGLHIRVRLVVLSNFHVQSFSIRATVYFILILKDLNHF